MASAADLGNDAQAREDARAVWLAPFIDQTIQDVRYAWRQMRRAPGFTVTAILLSGLGVGATTAVFSVANAVLFVPLPYPEPNRILALGTRAGGGVDGQTYHTVQARDSSFAAVAAQRQTGGWSLVAGSHAEPVRGLKVSSRYFDVLGVTPQIGRSISPDEDAPGGLDVVVISAELRRRTFGEQPDVLGSRVLLGRCAACRRGCRARGIPLNPAGRRLDATSPLRTR